MLDETGQRIQCHSTERVLDNPVYGDNELDGVHGYATVSASCALVSSSSIIVHLSLQSGNVYSEVAYVYVPTAVSTGEDIDPW